MDRLMYRLFYYRLYYKIHRFDDDIKLVRHIYFNVSVFKIWNNASSGWRGERAGRQMESANLF